MGRITPKVIDEYLGFEAGTFNHIPHYAREEAIDAMRQVMKVERSRLFRPGLYYIVLSDLSRSTEASAILGTDLNKKRVESFILRCVECLTYINPENYFWFVREIGDAVLLLFSSFRDAYTGGGAWNHGLTLKMPPEKWICPQRYSRHSTSKRRP
jgi:hypothetical protein